MKILNTIMKKLQNVNAPEPEPVKEAVVLNQPIDYSVLPFNLNFPLTELRNRTAVADCAELLDKYLQEAIGYIDMKFDFHIDSHDLLFIKDEYTSLKLCENTKTGKVPKYIAELRIMPKSEADEQPAASYVAHVYFLQDGSIGKASLHCGKHRKNKYEYINIDLGMKGKTLIIKKVSTSDKHGFPVLLYKDM